MSIMTVDLLAEYSQQCAEYSEYKSLKFCLTSRDRTSETLAEPSIETGNFSLEVNAMSQDRSNEILTWLKNMFPKWKYENDADLKYAKYLN